MGPIFYKKNAQLNMGPIFLNEPKFSAFRMAKTLKIAKIVKNGPIFQEKSLTMQWVPFSAKMTLKDG